jgi:IclR family pca regulon transcriptional regulator
MARRDTSPDFIEALARGLDVIRAFQPGRPAMSLAAVAGATGLARPTARRILLTLEQMGYVRAVEPLDQMGHVRAVDREAVDPKAVDRKAVDRKYVDRKYELTPRVLELGMSYVLSRNLWEVARPHMERLVARTHESSSIAQLDGSDIVYVARVAVPKIVALAVTIGTRFPAMQTSLGKVLLAALSPEGAERVLAEPSRSGIPPRIVFSSEERAASLREVRARGWALTDEELAAGIRSVAAPLRDGEGRVIASLNVNTHAAETPVEVLTGEHLPLLLQTAGAISADWAACQAAPQVTVPQPAGPQPAPQPLALP